MRLNTTESVYASRSGSKANLMDTSGNTTQTNREKKKMYDAKKSLTETLSSTAKEKPGSASKVSFLGYIREII